MAIDTILLGTTGPWLHPFVATEPDAWDFVMLGLPQLEGVRLAGRTIRGRKSRTRPSLFDECAAAVQFPYYFGENWDAFEECVKDLEWLHADAYVLLITDSIHLLEFEAAEQIDVLFRILDSAGGEWGQPVQGEFPRSARPFHVLLQCTPDDEPTLSEKLRVATVTASVLRMADV